MRSVGAGNSNAAKGKRSRLNGHGDPDRASARGRQVRLREVMGPVGFSRCRGVPQADGVMPEFSRGRAGGAARTQSILRLDSFYTRASHEVDRPGI
jgi:hypothetical protein